VPHDLVLELIGLYARTLKRKRPAQKPNQPQAQALKNPYFSAKQSISTQ
jgi:hypothetical protein